MRLCMCAQRSAGGWGCSPINAAFALRKKVSNGKYVARAGDCSCVGVVPPVSGLRGSQTAAVGAATYQ